jgi:hypothetical protein
MKLSKISDTTLRTRYKKIKPLIRYVRKTSSKIDKLEKDEDGDLHHLKKSEDTSLIQWLKNVAYTWDPTPGKLADEVNPKPFTEIETFHSYGYYGMFKPSVGEVISQIPVKDIKRTVAFEVIMDSVAIDGEYHRAITRLYETKS